MKRQIKSKQFTQDIIDTLGKRLTELIIPVPKDKALASRIAKGPQEIIEGRARLLNRARAITLELQGQAITDEDFEAGGE